MKLWYVRNIFPGWGAMLGIVVRAEDEARARQLASENAYGEGKDVWFDPDKTTCDEILAEGEEEVILASNAD